MRKLTKSFSEKYNFKRLLQTTPNLSKLYTTHEDAINSIKPFKHVQLISRLELRAFDPESKIDINAACTIERYGPGSDKWPCRIKYAEQILDVNYHGYSAWLVKVDHDREHVDILEFKNPYVTLLGPDFRVHNNIPIYNPKKLSRIDQNNFVTYFLANKATQECVMPLRRCSIIPSGIDIFNSTFYDREIAHLYAESLQIEVDKWYAYRPGQP